MRVIILVTAVAHHRQLDFVLYLIFMTGMAVDAVMFAIKRKIRLSVMVELPSQPVVGAMTELAFRP